MSGHQSRSGPAVSRSRHSDFSAEISALADAAKNHLRFKLAMGDVNKLGAYANKGDWAWKVIEDTVQQKSNAGFRKALSTAQQDATIKRNLTTYVSNEFPVFMSVIIMNRLDLVEVGCTTVLLGRLVIVLQATINSKVISPTKSNGS